MRTIGVPNLFLGASNAVIQHNKKRIEKDLLPIYLVMKRLPCMHVKMTMRNLYILLP